MTQELWLRLLWTLSLCDHLGDVNEAVAEFAHKANLPIPEDGWQWDELRAWVKDQGVERGIYGE